MKRETQIIALTAAILLAGITAPPGAAQEAPLLPVMTDKPIIVPAGAGGQVLAFPDATDCSKWFYVPHRWRVLTDPSRSFATLRWRDEGFPTHVRHYPEATYFVTYAPDLAAVDTLEAARALRVALDGLIAMEQSLIADGKLEADQALYAGKCDSSRTALYPMPLDQIAPFQRSDAQLQRSEWARFSADPEYGAVLQSYARINPILDGPRYDRRLGSGLRGPDVIAQLPLQALNVAVDSWLEVSRHDTAVFDQYTRSARYLKGCTEECHDTHFLWFRVSHECHTSCEWGDRTWTEQFLRGLTQTGGNTIYFKAAQDDAAGVLEARTELLNRFALSNFEQRVTQADQDVVRIVLGELKRQSDTVYHGSYRKLQITPVALADRLDLSSPVPADLLKPVEDFVASASYRCANRERDVAQPDVLPGFVDSQSDCPAYPGSEQE
jgi:hypothetical protein